jgi:hypothetical protein
MPGNLNGAKLIWAAFTGTHKLYYILHY